MRSLPSDPAWLRRFFGEGLDPRSIADVWPEAYSANSAQKVWAAKVAAHHPNIAVVDLSSMKCGHDAPTYGIIDQVLAGSGTGYAALHDIDANKPEGSMKIRVKTYAHTLERQEERLRALGAQRQELLRRVEAKRRALLGDWADDMRGYQPSRRPAPDAGGAAGLVQIGALRRGGGR
jgi:hypothetical protein